tara:strand:+ start:45979 stop:46836 length:858 start_codon:yes stop_codon:yes gene_type:complete
VIFGAKFPDFCIAGIAKFRPEGLFLTAPEQDLASEEVIAARVCHDELVSLSDADLDARWKTRLVEEEAKREAALPLNQHVADAAAYDFYSKAAFWTVEEACALMVARHPRKVGLQTVKPYASISKTARQFLDLHDLATRAVAMNQLAHRNLPGFFLAWAGRNRLSIPEGLAAAIQLQGVQVADWKTLYDQQTELVSRLEARISQLETGASPTPTDSVAKPLGELARTSLLKLVIGMAVKGYGHNPKASRTGTASEIASDLRLVGLSLDEDTIRKYLAEARELLPD